MTDIGTNGQANLDSGYSGGDSPPADRSGNAGGGVVDRQGHGRSGAVAGGANLAHVLATETEAARNLIADLADILGDDAELIATTIDGETNLNAVMIATLNRIAELNGLMDGIAGMMANMKDRGERLERQRDNLRALLCEAMSTAGVKKLEAPAGTVSLRSVPPKAEIINEADIPAKFWKPQPPKLDKKSVLDALKAREAVPGATLSNGGVTVNIKLD